MWFENTDRQRHNKKHVYFVGIIVLVDDLAQ